MKRRSNCPISNVLDHVGDKWSLLIIRDIALYGKQTYKALLESDESMATNVLATRLAQLEESGILAKQTDATDKRKKLYCLTEQGRDFIPLLIDMTLWSAKYDCDTAAPAAFVERAKNDRDGLISDLVAKLK